MILQIKKILEKNIYPKKLYIKSEHFDPLSTNVPLPYLMKTSENRRFPDVFGGYRSLTLVENGLILLLPVTISRRV